MDNRPEFNDFMRERQRPLLRFAMVLSGDARIAEEIVADVLSRAWEKWDRIGAMEQPNSYVRRMIVNEFISWRRYLTRTSPRADLATLIDETPEGSGASNDFATNHAERDALIAQLARLPRKQRAAIVLRFYEHMSDAEIAAMLGIGEVTVRSNISRALASMRIHLQDTDFIAAGRPSVSFI